MSFEEVESPAPDPAAPNAVANYGSTREMLATPGAAPGGYIEGEFNSGYIKLPYVNLTQKMSSADLLEFGVGSLVFDKAVKVGDTRNPLEITVLRLKKQYRQNLPQGAQEMPQTFNSMAEVRAAGMVLGSTRDGKSASEQGVFQLAIKAPATLGEDELARFPYEHNGSHWAPAMFIASSTAYGSFVKPVITLSMPGQPLAGGPFLGKFELHVEKRTNPKGEFFAPKPLFKGLHSAEEVAFFKSIIGE